MTDEQVRRLGGSGPRARRADTAFGPGYQREADQPFRREPAEDLVRNGETPEPAALGRASARPTNGGPTPALALEQPRVESAQRLEVSLGEDDADPIARVRQRI